MEETEEVLVRRLRPHLQSTSPEVANLEEEYKEVVPLDSPEGLGASRHHPRVVVVDVFFCFGEGLEVYLEVSVDDLVEAVKGWRLRRRQ